MLQAKKRANGRVGAPAINQNKPGARVPRRMERGDVGVKLKSPKCWLGLYCKRTFTVKGSESLLRNLIPRLEKRTIS